LGQRAQRGHSVLISMDQIGSPPWEVLSRKTVFRGGPIQDIAIETVRLPGGRVIDDYYAIRLPDYVLIYPEMSDGTLRILRQYKHGLRRACLSFPGGAIEAGESPETAARRELLEELGCAADQWHSLGAFTANGNQGCNTAHLFRATGCRAIAAPLAPDLEQPKILNVTPDALLDRASVLDEFGLASHVALLLIATNQRFNRRG
jgi:ADP-ribose pyrophosphatase